MAHRGDGSEVLHKDALTEWASTAYRELREVARTYNRVISYRDLAESIQSQTDLHTRMLLPNWIGDVLEIAAQTSADAEEPPLTSLCLHGDGTIGEGYERAPKYRLASTAADIEVRGAEDRLSCYRRFASDTPADGGRPTLSPQVVIARRKANAGAVNDLWLSELIETGSLSVSDRVPFHDHLQVAQLFGKTYRGHHSATIRLDDLNEVWFPKMYANGDWENSQSKDGETITMKHVAGGQYGSVMQTAPVRKYFITFGHEKPTSGPSHYLFLGVFEGAPHLSDSTRWVHQRVADTVRFDGAGGFTFHPTRSRPVQDDQAAEAADADPRLIVEYQQSLDSGAFAVDDQFSNAKVRGSAQAVFAKAVKDNHGWKCAVTGIQTPAFLVASHIVPWSEDRTIRLDPSNGICLSTFVDRAFDAGYLSITPEGRTAVRWEKVVNDPILKLELDQLDDVELSRPLVTPWDPAKLARRIELDR